MAKRHLIGIGGVGMSALATALVRLGDTVTGADRTLGTPNICFLESLGVRVFPDDGSGVDGATDEVIVSTAIEATNAGLRKAKELGIPVTHRATALARTLQDYKLVAVAGTCGKSTVTAMLGHVLAACGLDPICVNGANVPGWEGAVRFGRGEYAVAEVDESDKSLVAFRPYAAIVTNASADHYSKAEMDAVFDAFVRDCSGPVIDGRAGGNAACGAEGEGDEWVTPMPGRHNRQNAALAARMALALGCAAADVRRALLSFCGVERRLQRIVPPAGRPSGSAAPVVFDDYAHNPEKLRAMWTTLAERYPQGVCAIWRPHGYAPLRKLMDALAAMFVETIRPQDALLLLPVYDAGGTTDRSVNSGELAAKVCGGGRRCVLVAGPDAAYDWCAARRNDFGALVTCGARDPGLPALAKRLSEM
ncbi:MAG: Mur ligase domain-containing protein [Kiritimatiellia bacterium]